MDLLRLQLSASASASAITDGLRKARAGETDDGLRLIEHGLAALQGLLADVEAKPDQGERNSHVAEPFRSTLNMLGL